ncbi:MAG TPA: TldD/PmbA family protein [candidate division Zixibacteria bacterium]|nr:TldD/PmbA family protein [candidate division Zixibacteria bacterium]
MIDKVQHILEKVDFKKGDFADIRVQKGYGTSITIQNGRPEQINFDKDMGVGIRALINGGWGFVSMVGFDVIEIEKALKKAIKIAETTAKKIENKGVMPEEYSVQGTYEVKFKIDPRNIAIEDKYTLVEEFEKTTRTYSDKIVSTNASLKNWFQKELIVNTLGTKVINEYGNLNILCMATSREGDIMQNVYTSEGTTNGWEEMEKYDVVNKGVELGERAVKLLKAQKPPSGKMDIVMDPSLVGVYVHESFGHAEEADSILAKDSILEGLMGSQLGSNLINIYDDPTIPGLRGSYCYDSEGTKTIKRQLVKEGTQVGYLHSLETATKMGEEPNGAARAMNFNHRPVVRMGNTYIDSGDLTFEELLELVNNGVYLENSYGGYVDTAKGEFYFSAQGGYLIRNGKLAEPIQNVSMSGLCLEVLERTVGVGKNLQFAFPGSCGKSAQWVPVHAGGPALAVRQIVVGGQ